MTQNKNYYLIFYWAFTSTSTVWNIPLLRQVAKLLPIGLFGGSFKSLVKFDGWKPCRIFEIHKISLLLPRTCHIQKKTKKNTILINTFCCQYEHSSFLQEKWNDVYLVSCSLGRFFKLFLLLFFVFLVTDPIEMFIKITTFFSGFI